MFLLENKKNTGWNIENFVVGYVCTRILYKVTRIHKPGMVGF